MSAPLFKIGLFGADASLVVAFLIGIGFGFFLERAGFGSARKLVSQFYLNDLAVFKVMFTAIVTAMLGVTFLSWVGILDLSLVYLTPTYLLPQIVGGLVLGFGFVIGGYCPGTSVAATATGKIDGVVYILGVIAGTLVFAEAYPLVKTIHVSTPLGATTIPQYFGLPYGTVVFAVVLMAVGGFAGATWIEKKISKTERPMPVINRRLAAVALCLGAIAILARPSGPIARVDTEALAATVQKGSDLVQSAKLATIITSGVTEFRLIDLRDEAAYAAYHIPGAENIRLTAIKDAGISHDEKIVVYSDNATESAQAWLVLKAAGFVNASVLNGGVDAWKRSVLRIVDNAGQGDPAATPTTMPKVDVPTLPAGATKAMQPAKKKKEGC